MSDIQQPPIFFPSTYTGPGPYASYRARFLNSDGSLRAPPDAPSAALLYAIVGNGADVHEARIRFNAGETGEDSSGNRIFTDGWGQPIYFLRCAPGYVAAMAPDEADPIRNHDPFDAVRIDATAFNVRPLAYSAGRDGEFGLWQEFRPTAPGYPYHWANASFTPFNDPDLGRDVLVGSPVNDGLHDNLTSQDGVANQ